MKKGQAFCFKYTGFSIVTRQKTSIQVYSTSGAYVFTYTISSKSHGQGTVRKLSTSHLKSEYLKSLPMTGFSLGLKYSKSVGLKHAKGPSWACLKGQSQEGLICFFL